MAIDKRKTSKHLSQSENVSLLGKLKNWFGSTKKSELVKLPISENPTVDNKEIVEKPIEKTIEADVPLEKPMINARQLLEAPIETKIVEKKTKTTRSRKSVKPTKPKESMELLESTDQKDAAEFMESTALDKPAELSPSLAPTQFSVTSGVSVEFSEMIAGPKTAASPAASITLSTTTPYEAIPMSVLLAWPPKEKPKAKEIKPMPYEPKDIVMLHAEVPTEFTEGFKSLLQKLRESLQEKYNDDINNKKITISELPKNEKHTLGLQIEVIHDRTNEKDIIQYYQNEQQGIEGTISRDSDYKSIGILFELFDEFPVLKADVCKDPISLIKLYKAAIFSGKEIHFEETDLLYLNRLPEYNKIIRLTYADFKIHLEERKELELFSKSFKEREFIEIKSEESLENVDTRRADKKKKRAAPVVDKDNVDIDNDEEEKDMAVEDELEGLNESDEQEEDF